MTNRLSESTSPYLLQHADNPVDWYPWGEEAFAEAGRRDVPIHLSVGYSACHWCHVMARESFQDPETAELMNRLFVNIKVDREERPDIDSLYMDAVQITTGRGGWPMTVFLTPRGEPFFAGTYFPPEDRAGIPGFRRVLLAVSDIYQKEREHTLEEAQKLTRALENSTRPRPASVEADTLDAAVEAIMAAFDDINGGFGHAPKFPQPMVLEFCLRRWARSGDARCRRVVETTLRAMALGGIYDQIGGGFARYSVDSRWRVPHFEKMLYDNAQLARVYLWAGIAFHSEFYKRIARETLDYLIREMQHQGGGFFSSTDADSEGLEGKYFIWDFDEFVETVGDLSEVAVEYFGLSPDGNFDGANVLRASAPLEEIDPADAAGIMAARSILFDRRRGRRPPSVDDKVITSWNALVIWALADAARALGASEYSDAALAAAAFVDSAITKEGQLHRSWRAGRLGPPAFADDHANLGNAYLALFRSTGDWRWVERAEAMADVLVENFVDDDGIVRTNSEPELLLLRPIETFDNAVPSASSSAALLFLGLAPLLDKPHLNKLADKIVTALGSLASRAPLGEGLLLYAADTRVSPGPEIVITGVGTKANQLRDLASRAYLPGACLVTRVDSAPIDTPLLAGKDLRRDVAYVCTNFTCAAPALDEQQLRAQLAEFFPNSLGS